MRSLHFAAGFILLGLLPSAARAQLPFRLPGDYIGQRLDQWWLERDQARLQEDLSRGDPIRINSDLNRIQADQWQLWHDDRRIQADHLRPVPPRMPAPARIPLAATFAAPSTAATGAAPASGSVEIRYKGRPGSSLGFVLDGATYSIKSGETARLAVSPNSRIAFDRGGDFGVQQHALPTGSYEFRPTQSGWSLLKLSPASTPSAPPVSPAARSRPPRHQQSQLMIPPPDLTQGPSRIDASTPPLGALRALAVFLLFQFP